MYLGAYYAYQLRTFQIIEYLTDNQCIRMYLNT